MCHRITICLSVESILLRNRQMSYLFIATEPYSIQTILPSRKHARSSPLQFFGNCLLFLWRKSVSALPAKRLWTYLVNDEQAQGIFIKYIFKRKPAIPPSLPTNISVPKVSIRCFLCIFSMRGETEMICMWVVLFEAVTCASLEKAAIKAFAFLATLGCESVASLRVCVIDFFIRSCWTILINSLSTNWSIHSFRCFLSSRIAVQRWSLYKKLARPTPDPTRRSSTEIQNPSMHSASIAWVCDDE